MAIKNSISAVWIGDVKVKTKELANNSIDSVVTDPPYELGFMGKKWDNTGIAYDVEMWKDVYRVLKPGGFLLSFGGTRTYHRMTCAIEDAGFEIRDMIEWVYGSGFPKSLDIANAIDKQSGTERVILSTLPAGSGPLKTGHVNKGGGGGMSIGTERSPGINITKPASVDAIQWSGWGTALKPAHEPIVVARKPLSANTVAENVLFWGTGGINIDGSRITTDPTVDDKRLGGNGCWQTDKGMVKNIYMGGFNGAPVVSSLHGRFPANLIHDGSTEVIAMFPKNAGAAAPVRIGMDGTSNGIYGDFKSKGDNGATYYHDKGSAARFFKTCEWAEVDLWPLRYCAKASKTDRGTGNTHPTVKPVSLMKYLIKLVTPPGGVVLDPFAGSGTTLVSAEEMGFGYVGIEKEKEHVEIINCRLARSRKEPELQLMNQE